MQNANHPILSRARRKTSGSNIKTFKIGKMFLQFYDFRQELYFDK